MRLTKHLRRPALLGLLVSIAALMAAGPASAQTVTPVWTSDGLTLPYGLSTSYSATSVTGMDLKFHAAFQSVWIQCQTLKTAGTVKNPAVGVPGTITLPHEGSAFQGCTLILNEAPFVPTTCTVPAELPVAFPNNNVASLSLKEQKTPQLVLPELKIRFKIENCPGSLGYYENVLEGQVRGEETSASWPGELLVSESESSLHLEGGIPPVEMNFGLNIEKGSQQHIKAGIELTQQGGASVPAHWYQGGGERTGEGPKRLVPEGSPLAVGSGSAKMLLGTTISGVRVEFKCSAPRGTGGTVENPVGGSDGVAQMAFGFSGCTVIVADGLEKGCQVEGGSITPKNAVGSSISSGGEKLYAFKASSGTTLGVFHVINCSVAALNGEYTITGSLLVQPRPSGGFATGSWRIPAAANLASTGLLRIRGGAASASGQLTVQNGSGEAVAIG